MSDHPSNHGPLRIGVISDTHGLLHPKVPGIFEGVEHILHAGDIGPASIVMQLEKLAPVTAVLGNNDFGLNYQETERIRLADRDFFVRHIVDVHAPHEWLLGLTAPKPDVVVFGHSHKPHNQMVGDTLFLNPGYAGKPRFNLSRSVAILQCHAKEMQVSFVPLD